MTLFINNIPEQKEEIIKPLNMDTKNNNFGVYVGSSCHPNLGLPDRGNGSRTGGKLMNGERSVNLWGGGGGGGMQGVLP